MSIFLQQNIIHPCFSGLQHPCSHSSLASEFVSDLHPTPPSEHKSFSGHHETSGFGHTELSHWIKEFFHCLHWILTSKVPFWRKYLKTSSSKVCEKRVLPFLGLLKSCWTTDYWGLLRAKKKFLVKDKENWNFILISTDFDLAIYLANVIPVSPSKSLSPKWCGLSELHT